MATLNETPKSNRLHIGIFGKTNSGKSSFINAFTGQDVSIVADVKGTTTDPVYKAMEINPLGACVIIDTAGFDDDSELGKKRIEKTDLAAEKTDIAVIIFSASDDKLEKLRQSDPTSGDSIIQNIKEIFPDEWKWINIFMEKKTPLLLVVNKADVNPQNAALLEKELSNLTGVNSVTIKVSCNTGEGIELVKPALARLLPEDFDAVNITGDVVSEDDMVMLVMPQDIQAPKGRLILPQVQTIRELLDKKCSVMCVTTDKMVSSLKKLIEPPKLIITDSQVFD